MTTTAYTLLHGPTSSRWLRCPVCGGRTSTHVTDHPSRGHLRCDNDAQTDHPFGHVRGRREALRPLEAGVDDPVVYEQRCPWPGLRVERATEPAPSDWTAIPLEPIGHPDHRPLPARPRLPYPLPLGGARIAAP